MVTVTKQSSNGHFSPAVQAGAKSTLTAPRVERWVDVPDSGYRVKLWINYPRTLKSAFQPIDPDEVEQMDEDALETYGTERKAAIEQAMAAIILEHNGWPDEDGNVLPQPFDPTLWELADQHLMNVVLALALQAPSQLPNSLLPMRRR